MTAATEIWNYRNLILNLAQRELRARYKKSLLGWLWSLINPLSMLLIYSLVFGVFFRTQPPTAGNGQTQVYGLYLFAGLVVWNFFNSVVTGSIVALQGAGGLLNKVYFPPAAPAIANMMTVMLQAFIEGGILALIMIALGNVGIQLVLFPLMLVFLAFFALGLGLFFSIFNVYYRDVGHLVGIGMQLLFYATPIIYPITLVTQHIGGVQLSTIINLNPLTQFVAWSRSAFYTLQWPTAASLVFTPLAAVGFFLAGSWVFARKARNVSEEL